MTVSAREPLRLAILGAGTIGTIHGLCSLETPELTVSRVWSRTSARARALADRLGATACVGFEDAVSADDVDAVVVCTPTSAHHDHAVAALRAGKHVICEKPLARQAAHVEDMIGEARSAGRHLYPAHVVRFFPEFRRMHDLVQSGAIGTPALARLSRVASFPHGSGEWHADLMDSGGAVFDMGIHDVDWLLWTFGSVERVAARGLAPQQRPFLDYGLVTLRMRSGVIAHVEASWAETEGFRTSGELVGSKGLLTYDSAKSTAFRIALREPPDMPPGVNVPTTYTAENPYVAQLEHLARAIRGEEEPVVTAEEGLAAVQVSLAALESMHTERTVTLPGGDR